MQRSEEFPSWRSQLVQRRNELYMFKELKKASMTGTWWVMGRRTWNDLEDVGWGRLYRALNKRQDKKFESYSKSWGDV